MIKIKSQKITPAVPAESPRASFILSSHDLPEHSGDWDFFAVFDFEGNEPVNTKVATNVVSDVFSHLLILDESAAVLQVLEKSLRDSKEALQKMQGDVKFNAVAAVIKDGFVYISIYGNSKALYLDGSQIVHVDTEKEGNYAGATQKIEDSKVMVLCTSGFFEKFPPKSLTSLAKPILSQDLDDVSSAVIIKVDKEEAMVSSPEPKPPESSKTSPEQKESVRYIEIKGNKAEKNRTARKTLRIVLAVLLAVLLTLGGYFAYRNLVLGKAGPTGNPGQQDSQNLPPAENADETGPSPAPEVQGELTKKLDEANRVRRVSAQVFYDISITDARTAPTELASGTTYLAVSDSAQGKVYISSKSVTKFEELPQLFPGVRNLLFDGDTLIFTDNEGVKFYSIATKSVSKSFLAAANYPKLGPASEYLGFTYALSSDSLVKFSKAGNQLSGTLWLQKPEFANGVSMDIDGSIYVLFSNGSLEKYTTGKKDDFSIVGLDKPIQKPLKVVTDAEFKQIYVADGEEGRIVVFDTDGVLDFQIKPQLGSEWTSLKSFDILRDEKTFYVLSGTKVFEFSL